MLFLPLTLILSFPPDASPPANSPALEVIINDEFGYWFPSDVVESLQVRLREIKEIEDENQQLRLIYRHQQTVLNGHRLSERAAYTALEAADDRIQELELEWWESPILWGVVGLVIGATITGTIAGVTLND